MNERIRKLAEQAEMAANKGDHVDVKIMMVKFAQLIVAECTAQCEKIAQEANAMTHNHNVTATGGMLYEGMWSGATNCSVAIREHFGVEE